MKKATGCISATVNHKNPGKWISMFFILLSHLIKKPNLAAERKPSMKSTLRFFAFLDILSFLLLSQQVFQILGNFQNIPQQGPSTFRVVLLLIIYPLLLVSAYGLFRLKEYGFVSYYIQFPIRLLVWVFSFGFLTLVSQYFANPLVFDWLFRTAVVLEFFRLYFTIQIHRRHFRGLRTPNT